MPLAPGLVAELNANLPGALRRGDAPLPHGAEDDRLPTGLALLDEALAGGLPRGRLSELVGTGSTGATSLVQRIVGHVTEQGHLVAWVDAPDAFDPASAAEAGIALERLLWVRPPDLATAFAAAEALLVLGGFPLVLLDASAAATRTPARKPRPRDLEAGNAAHAWVRLARAAARSRSTLLVLRRSTTERGAAAGGGSGSAAALRLELESPRVLWDASGGAPTLLDGLVARVVVRRNRGACGGGRVVLPLK